MNERLDTPKPSPTTESPTAPPAAPSSWLSHHLANFLAVVLTLGVFWLAYKGDAQAQAAIISGFSMLVGLLLGSRLSLKIPGKDR